MAVVPRPFWALTHTSYVSPRVNPARVVVVVELSTDAEGPTARAVSSNENTPNPVTAVPRVTVEGVQEIVAVPSPCEVSVTDVGPWGTAWTGVEAAELPTLLVAVSYTHLTLPTNREV